MPGDVHGQFEDLRLALELTLEKAGLEEEDITCMFLVGDVEAIRSEEEMRMVHGPAKYRKMGDFSKVLSGEVSFSMPIYFIGGNHEPWEALDKDGGLPHGGNWGGGLTFLGRAGQVELHGLQVAYLSAISSPEMRRTQTPTPGRNRNNRKDRTYWSWEEVQRVLRAGQKKRPDILLTHEWPTGVGTGRDGNEAGSWQVRDLIEKTRPQVSFHGHMHHKSSTQIGDTEVVALDHIRSLEKALTLYEQRDSKITRVL